MTNSDAQNLNQKRVVTYRKLVMIGDLNPAKRAFGGQMLAWADEAAALYAMCQLHTTNLVTVKFSEVIFKKPVVAGDFLEFIASTKSVGNTSLTVLLEITKKNVESGTSEVMVTCDIVFVCIDENGKPKPHGRATW